MELRDEYWIFQYTTEVYKTVIEDLDNNMVSKWEVTKHRKNIKKNHLAILYIGGGNAKFLYGIAEITSDPAPIGDGRIFSNIRVLKKFEKRITLKDAKLRIPKLKIGISGTNFSCSPEEYNEIISLTNL